MKNNKVLTIVLICICSIFTILLSIFLVVSIKDKNKFTFNFDFFKKGESNNLIYNESFDDINKKNDTVTVKVLENDYFYFDFMKDIKNSSDNKAILKMYGSEKSKDDLKVTNEEDLNINVESKGCIGFCFNNEVDKVILYLPETFDKKINIENSYGDAKIEKFENVILNAKISSGDINVDTVKEIVLEISGLMPNTSVRNTMIPQSMKKHRNPTNPNLIICSINFFILLIYSHFAFVPQITL